MNLSFYLKTQMIILTDFGKYVSNQAIYYLTMILNVLVHLKLKNMAEEN